MRRKRKGKDPEEVSFWQSYSDMMAALLLVFVLIIAVANYSKTVTSNKLEEKVTQYMEASEENDTLSQQLKEDQISLAQQQAELNAQQAKLDAQKKTMEEQQAKLDAQQETMDEQAEKLEAQQTELDKQKATVEAQQTELDKQKATVEAQQTRLNEQEETLKSQQETLAKQAATMEEQETELEEQKITVAEQQETLAAQQKTMEDQQAKLDEQEVTLKSQQATLTEQQETMAAQQKTMEDQQASLNNIIGVRTDLIETLKTKFDGTDLAISVDPETGAISFDSNILFDYGETVLKDSGKEFLNEFFPEYFDTILSDEFSQYIAEIIIEGHTDQHGSYLVNLDISQGRAFSVAEYCLGEDSDMFSEEELTEIRKLVTANGRSSNDLIYEDEAETIVDEDASRRVEIKFRLTEDEMIQQLSDILEQ